MANSWLFIFVDFETLFDPNVSKEGGRRNSV